MQDHKKFWLGLNLIKGIGSSRLRGLYVYFQGDLEAAWHASADELENAGLDEKVIEQFFTQRRKLKVDRVWKRFLELDAQICTFVEPEYPSLLKELPSAPPLLYYRGRLSIEDDRALAIVGTRRATTYGRDVARQMATAVAQAGITVISGLAIGIDGIAHTAALESSGRTIAVLGNGIDRIYPVENQKLAETIISQDQGAIISEYPPGTPPDAKHFPSRNRIISGLALGVLIVEAPPNSGTMHTANAAAEQGREVFAIPGNILSLNSQGTNLLIQEGAKLVTQPQDILDELNLSHRLAQTRQAVRKISPSDVVEAALIELLELEPLHVDEIAIQSGMTIHDVSARMTMMSLKGMVRETAPMTYGLPLDT